MWVLDYEADIESDLSAFHRIDDVSSMDGPRYFLLAPRLPAYRGALRARIEAERERENDQAPVAQNPRAASPAAPSRVPDSVMLARLQTEGLAEHTKDEVAV